MLATGHTDRRQTDPTTAQQHASVTAPTSPAASVNRPFAARSGGSDQTVCLIS